MCGIFTLILVIVMLNVGKYSIIPWILWDIFCYPSSVCVLKTAVHATSCSVFA